MKKRCYLNMNSYEKEKFDKEYKKIVKKWKRKARKEALKRQINKITQELPWE